MESRVKNLCFNQGCGAGQIFERSLRSAFRGMGNTDITQTLRVKRKKIAVEKKRYYRYLSSIFISFIRNYRLHDEQKYFVDIDVGDCCLSYR